MKKLITLLLSLTLVFSLAACGGQNKTTDTETSQPTSENSTAPESTPEPSTQPIEKAPRLRRKNRQQNLKHRKERRLFHFAPVRIMVLMSA